MKKRITIIQGHPDPAGGHFGHALARAYIRGASDAGHEVKLIEIASIDFPLLRSQRDWNTGVPPIALQDAQTTIDWAQHLVVFFPLWLGTMPALLQGFFEQVLRPGFAFEEGVGGRFGKQRLSGKSARLVVTMGMPVPIYRWYFFAHGLRGMERSILGLCGISPIRETLIGMVEANPRTTQEKWLLRLEKLGRVGK
jgi:putative NADPH-quinone reductase